MKFLFLVFSIYFINTYLYSQSKSEDEQMKIMKQMGELTPKHDFLNQFVGDWNLKLINYSGLDEIAGTGTANALMVYKGHYLEINLASEFSAVEMVSQIAIGYDTRINQYFLISKDDMTNYPLILTKGTLDQNENQLTLTGKDYVLMYKKEVNVRIVLKKYRDNKFTLKIYYQKDKTDKLIVEYLFIKKP
jgi:hypothetical protein